MTIDICELRSILTLLLDSTEEYGSQIEVSADYYWDVPKEARYDTYDSPPELTIGQLSDDWNELQRIRHGQSPAIPYALVWLAAVIRRIGEELPADVPMSDAP
jgi:hypothetical protein